MLQRPCATAALLAACGVWTLAGGCKPQDTEPDRNPHFQDGGYSAVLDELGVPHQTLRSDTKPIDLAQWPKDGAVNGPAPARITGAEVGLSPAEMPGVKLVPMGAVQKMDVIEQGTGLFVVGIDFIPRELPEILKSKGLTLRPNGELVDQNGQRAVAFVTGEVYRMALPDSPRQQSWLPDLLRGLSDALVPPAQAASPFPFRCFSFTPWALYHGGFHRWYEADTWTAAYGVDGSGRCSSASPRTRIDFLQAAAAVDSPGSIQRCFTCDERHAHDEWDVGWWWPAHGIPITSHSGIWADGRFSFSRSANLTW